jgi:hypothetical protein
MTTLGKTIKLRCCQLAFITLSGCSMYEAGARNALGENFARLNTNLICTRDCIAAKEVWATVCAAEPDQHYSKDYALGFQRGFSDFLQEGGYYQVARPLPPYRYWSVCNQTPEGMAAVEDWYAGYQRGLQTAHDSPLRELSTVRTIAALQPSKETVRIADVDYAGNKAGSITDLPPDGAPPPAPTTPLEPRR